VGSLRLRPCSSVDTELLFGWRNDPFIVARGSLGRAVSWDEHHRWVQQTLEQPEQRRLFIIEHEDQPIGQVRFDRHDERTCLISVYVLPPQIGRGLGTQAIVLGCRAIFGAWAVDEIIAQVRQDNPAGRASFLKTDFAPRPSTLPDHDELVRLRRPALGDPAHRIVPHNRLTHSRAEEEAAARCVAGGQWALGPLVERLESKLGESTHGRHAVGVASGLAALRLALRAVGVSAGDRVLVPAYSCVALADAVLACDAVPIAVEVDPDRYNLDVAAGQRAVQQHRPKAAILVHTFGAAAPVEAARSWGIPIIEDCAHAFGVDRLGALGNLSVLSFYATKLVGAGEGGAVLTDSPAIADWLRAERDYADRTAAKERTNDKLTAMAAALAICQLDRLPDLIARRQALAARYRQRLAAFSAGRFRLPAVESRIWYRYVVELHTRSAAEVARALTPLGVRAEEPVWDWRTDRAAQPVASRAYTHALSLPLYPTLTFSEQDQVVAALEEVLQ
jgi:perosamine synthetase